MVPKNRPSRPGRQGSGFERLLYNQARVTNATYRGDAKSGKLGRSPDWYLPDRGVTIVRLTWRDAAFDEQRAGDIVGACACAAS